MSSGVISSTSFVLYPMTDQVSEDLSRLSSGAIFCAKGRIENEVVNLMETRRFYILSMNHEKSIAQTQSNFKPSYQYLIII